MMENYENFDSFDFPPFVEAASAMPHDILDRTNEVILLYFAIISYEVFSSYKILQEW